jgi:hypothetical protein
MGFLKPPLPPVEKYIDLSYYDRAGIRVNGVREKPNKLAGGFI